MKLLLNMPINGVSFGQVSTVLLRTLYEREQAGTATADIMLMPIGGQADLSSQVVTQEFQTWLQNKINRTYESHTRDIPVFKLWHLNGSWESYGCHQTLLTFYELDNPTKVELTIARNSRLVLSSKYAIDIFKMFGVDASFLPLPFDSYNFKVVEKKYHEDDRIVFNLCGKLERRKHHGKVIQAWIKKYGGNPKFALQCATYNVFLGQNPQECDANNNELIRQILLGRDKPFNVSFLPHMRENVLYNDFLNSGSIILGMSGGEGWGLPEFQSVALGKHAVILNAHSYKTWATPETVTLVQPTGKISAVDNIFFRQGDAFNQGQIFDWNEDEFVAACEVAVNKYRSSPINTAGLTLQQTYSKEKFTDEIKLATP
jgi:hypothetical protein